MSAVPEPAAAGRLGLFYGWVLVGVFWLVLFANLAFPMYGGSVLNSLMATRLGFSHEALGLPFAVFLGVVGMSSPLVAELIRRLGVRRMLVLGNLAVAGGAVLMATVVASAGAATAVYGLVIGFGVASGGNLTAQTAIPRWFVRRRAVAFALMLTASAVGGFVAPSVMTSAVRAAGGDWRAGWWIIAALAAAAALLAGIAVREAPGDVGQHPDGLATGPAGAGSAATARDGSHGAAIPAVRAVLGSRLLWALAFPSAMATGSFGLMLAHGIANARQAGYSTIAAAWALSLLSAAGLGGKAMAVIGRDPARTWAALMLVMALGLAVGATRMPGGSLYLSAVLIGAGFGGVVVCQPATVADRVGVEAFARVASLVYFLQALAGIGVPWAAGRWYDAAGTYTPVFLLAAAGSALSAAVLLAIRHRTMETNR